MEQDFSYKNDIIATRFGGLGSSDAKMVLKLAEGGNLNATESRRIAEMLGMVEHRDIPCTFEMNKGNEFEVLAYKAMLLAFPQAKSNPLYVSENMSKSYGFNIFNHIDMEVETEDSLIWYEMKTSEKETADLLHDYNAQLAWHWMLLREKAAILGKTPALNLMHYPTFHGEFDMDLLRIVYVPYIANQFTKGFEALAAMLPTFAYTEPAEFSMDTLPATLQETLAQLANVTDQIKAAEEYAKQAREAIKEGFEQYCLPFHVSSLPVGEYNIVYMSGSTKVEETFNTAAAAADHPEFIKQVVTEVFDEEAFKAEFPEQYESYITKKTTTKNPSVAIRPKTNKK